MLPQKICYWLLAQKILVMIYKIDPQTISPYLKDASNYSGGSADKVIIPESSDELIAFLQNNNRPITIAGAGTGKTRVVTLRIANLINLGVAADRILAVTFTTKAAQEMRIRVGELVKGTGERKPLVSTFHSLCVKILRRHIELIGYPSRFTIYDASDQDTRDCPRICIMGQGHNDRWNSVRVARNCN